ncbi:MAG: HPF/RaiA family ribosome-associated protein [Flavobacteriales bacterium]
MTEIQVQSIHFDADQKLISFIREKVQKLNTFHDRIISGEVFLRLDKSDNHQNKISEVRITVPGHELFARKQCKSFEEATDHAVDALRSQISKIKK